LILERGVDVNRRFQNDSTALMWAAGYGHVEVLRMLLEAGARPELRDNRGKTASMIAREEGHPGAAEMLAVNAPRNPAISDTR
jgi:uncharacterized protein